MWVAGLLLKLNLVVTGLLLKLNLVVTGLLLTQTSVAPPLGRSAADGHGDGLLLRLFESVLVKHSVARQSLGPQTTAPVPC